MSYRDYRAHQLDAGQVYQDFVVDALARHLALHLQLHTSRHYQQTVGESRQGAEIKLDQHFARSRRLWIEYAEKAEPRRGLYVSSGIMRLEHWLYIIGDYQRIFVFASKQLRALKQSGRYPEQENRYGTSLAFFLPDADALRFAIAVLAPDDHDRAIVKALDPAHLAEIGHALGRDAIAGDQPVLWGVDRS